MSHYTHLTINERENAMLLLSEGHSFRAIARKLCRAVSTISREFGRNRYANGMYSANHAEKKYQKRRKCCHKPCIFSNPLAAEYVIKHLCEYRWTPEQIAGRAALDGFQMTFSYPTIYRAIESGILPKTLRKIMRFKCKNKKAKNGDKRGSLQNIKTIHERPAYVLERKVCGDWESDTVLGMRKTGSFGTHVDRATGFLVSFKLELRTKDAFNAATIKAFSKFPPQAVKSFTTDRGKEFLGHVELAKALGVNIYFCDPYAPWQRGINENANGLLRQFYPKKTSFADVTEDDLQKTVALINNRPRKRFGWRTPAELFADHLQALHLV